MSDGRGYRVVPTNTQPTWYLVCSGEMTMYCVPKVIVSLDSKKVADAVCDELNFGKGSIKFQPEEPKQVIWQ